MTQEPNWNEKNHRVALHSFKVAVISCIFTFFGTSIAALAFVYTVLTDAHKDAGVLAKLQIIVDILQGHPEKSCGTLPCTPVSPPPPVTPPPLTQAPQRVPAPQETILQTASDSGIMVSITGVSISGNSLSATFNIKNDTQNKLYFTDARTDPGQIFILNSGVDLKLPFPSGIPFCNNDASTCATNPSETSLPKYTSLAPGGKITSSMKWNISTTDATNAQGGSFSLVLMGRFLAANGNESEVPPPAPLRFNFSNLAIKHQ